MPCFSMLLPVCLCLEAMVLVVDTSGPVYRQPILSRRTLDSDLALSCSWYLGGCTRTCLPRL